MRPPFLTATPLAKALARYFRELEKRLQLTQPVTAYLAGGMAVHLYIGIRVTVDIDVEFGSRVAPPADLIIHSPTPEDPGRYIYLDTNYNPMFSLLHEDYQADSIPWETGTRELQLRVLSPLDLAVSKIARFQPADREDIAGLVEAGLVEADALERRASEAMSGFVGSVDMIRHNLRDAVEFAREIEKSRRPK